MRKVSIKDIAKKAGVSISTVSFVLNGKEKEMRISATVARRIRKMAEREGYHPNRAAVSLRTGQSKIIGLIVDTISGSFFSSLAKVIEREAASFGYKVIYCSTANGRNSAGELIRILTQHNVDGYLVIPDAGIKKQLAALIKGKNHVVMIDSVFKGLNTASVMVDNYGGVCAGVEWLVKKGHKKIGMVCSDLQMIQMQERIRGYRETMKKNKLRVTASLICETKYGGEQANHIAQMTEYFRKVKPQAVVFGANYLGVCGLEAIQRAGLRIPEDIGVVCFDEMDLFRLYPPGITSVRQPIEDIAHKSVELLMQELGVMKRGPERNVLISPLLIERASA